MDGVSCSPQPTSPSLSVSDLTLQLAHTLDRSESLSGISTKSPGSTVSHALSRVGVAQEFRETVGEGGESSDSDVYMSADEGLGNSRGDEKGGPLRRRERETENINGTHQNHPSDKESQRREEGSGEGEEGQEEVKKSSGSESIGERAGRENGLEEGEGEGGSMVEGEDVGKQSVRVERDTLELGKQLPVVDLVESREVKGEGGGESVREEEGEKEAGDKAEKKEEVEKVEEEEEGQGRGEKEGAESESKEPPQSSRQEETRKEVELPAKPPPRPRGDAGDETPIPPPRRKRKKKLQKNPSLENLEKVPDDTQLHRSMTVGSVDMSRERAPSNPRSPLSPTSPLLPPEGERPGRATGGSKGGREKEEQKRESKEKEGKTGGQLELRAGGWKGKQWRGEKSDKPRSPVASISRKMRKEEGAGGARRGSSARAPFISIEPNTSLELTEEMMLGGSEVVTTDTLLAKASGSDKHEMGIIIDSDDESLDGDGPFGSQELTDHGEQEADGEGEGEEGGEKGEVGGGAGVSQTLGESEERDEKEKTPLAVEEKGEKEKGKEKEEEQAKGRKNRAASPSDNQILQMTIVKNLDTGDSFPLSAADEKIPSGDPLSEHLIKRRAMEGHIDEGSGEDSHQRKKPLRRKLKQFLGKKRHKQHTEGAAAVHEGEGIPPVPGSHDPDQSIKYKPSSHNKGPYEFDKVRLKQDLTGHHLGAVWVMEFSICGRLLAVAGQDSIVRVWVLRNAAQFFHELQAKYQRFGVHSSGESLAEKASMASTCSSDEDDASATKGPFLELPICAYYGHTADILDLSWSKNFFLLSSSMDKTVRLWHISRKECLCCFQHVDFVTAIAFHPRDDRYFLSGSLDGKLRLWNIPDKRVALWNEIEGVGSHLITAANFCMNGKLAVAGTYDGRCIFYETEHLKYHTQIHVRSRHGKNRGRKISGIEPLPGEDKILVTSNDSRLRLYNLKDHSLSCKYKGGLNTSSQIRATFSRDGLSIISGSEDNFIYVWKTHHDVSKLSSARRDRNEFYESFTTHHAPVTAAVFAPVPGITVDEGLKEVGQMIVAADYQGCIKVYVNTEKL